MKRKSFKKVLAPLAIMAMFAFTACDTPFTNPTPDNDPTDTEEPEENNNVVVTTLSLDKENLYLAIDGVYHLSATSNSELTLIWQSSNSEVASVNSNGKVTGVSVGTATITVSSVDGSISASCLVHVEESDIAVEGVSLSYEQLDLEVGDSYSLNVTLEPYNATNNEVSWSSSDESVATVSNGVVSAKAEGSATITVTTTDGGFSASCLVNVTPKAGADSYKVDENDADILIITEAGEYTLERDYKQVYVNAPDAEVEINLNGHTIENSENSPIYVADCDSIDISATKKTTSYIKDTRAIYTEENTDQGKGAIYVANGDLKLKGTGALEITANYFNGIHVKDDVKIQKLTLDVTSVHHGIKGNDSVTITSGTINISCGGDGIKTENSDVSSKGNQKGNITINGGTVTVNSWGDAITASYDTVIEETDSSTPVVLELKTNKYSSYNGEVVDTSGSSFYIKMNSQTYANGNYTYAAYINNNWYAASYKGTSSTQNQGGQPGGGGWGGQPGGSSTYYIYEFEKPVDATSFKLYRFSGSNVTTFSTTNYNAVSDAKAFNDAYDMVQISVRNGSISFANWSNYASSNTVSAKGIKAENEVTIKSGTISINAYDDGVHANNDGSLENGSTPLGNVNISGGSLTISSADDGVHADGKLNLSGGELTVTTSYEGLEGNVINISGGTSYIYATDDGVNATSGSSTPSIVVSGGYLDVEVPTNGDTDGVDSNGTYTQSGGTVIIKGPGRAGSNNFGAAALDTDSTVKLTGGSLIVFGGVEQTPSTSGVTKTLCSSSTVSSGSHTVSFSSESYTTTLKTSTNGCIVYSSLGSATLR